MTRWFWAAAARLAEIWNPPPWYDDLARALLDRLRDRLDPATGLPGEETGPAPPPNAWVISLAPYDHARRHRSLPDWCRALADLALAEDRRHGHALGGVATVRVEQDPRLPPGTFRVSRDGGPAEAPGLVATPGEPGESPDGRPRLVLPFGGHVLPSHGDAGRQVLLTPGRTTVGRGPESAIRLGDVSVSLVHAHVDVEPDGTTRLSDAGSVNGLRVDGVRVRQAELVDGNRIELGSAALVYRRDPVDDDGGRQGGVGGDRG